MKIDGLEIDVGVESVLVGGHNLRKASRGSDSWEARDQRRLMQGNDVPPSCTLMF